jgi:hypothetical protein
MGVSGSRDFILNRDQICTAALRKLKVVLPGDTPSSDLITYAAEALNVMQLSWQNEGVFLWTNTENHFAITANTAAVTVSSTADTIEIDNVIYRENESDTKLTKLSLSEYMALTDKTVSGTPTHYYPEYLLSSTKIYLFPVYTHTTGVVTGTDASTYLCKNDHTSDSDTTPTTGTDYADDWEVTTELITGGAWADDTAYYSGHIRLIKTQRLQDFDAAANNPDFHARAYKALVDGLSAELAPEFRSLREVSFYQDRANRSFKSFLFGQAETGSLRIVPKVK